MPDTPAPAPSRALPAILWGGLIASFCDMVFAFTSYGLKLGVFQSVLGGLIGRPEARAGGVPTFVAGLSLHYLIGIIWAAIYWFASRRIPALVKYAIPAGLVYGAVVFYGMNCVVLPLSALHTNGWPPPWAPTALAVHMVGVGLPIALAVRKFSR
jgi:hypothetical protein